MFHAQCVGKGYVFSFAQYFEPASAAEIFMKEKTLEKRLCDVLSVAMHDPSILGKIVLHKSSTDVNNFFDLIGGKHFEIIEDNSDWNLHKGLLTEIAGGVIPDIVLRSGASGQNRIYIEVKLHAPLKYEVSSSQIIRYLLHLLATTSQNPPGVPKDIRRAVLLAAPTEWFENKTKIKPWDHFLNHFSELAKDFDVTLGAVCLAKHFVEDDSSFEMLIERGFVGR